MSDYDLLQISESRRIYQNPYAHIEYLDTDNLISTSYDKLNTAPKHHPAAILQNPYAFIEEESEEAPEAIQDTQEREDLFGAVAIEHKKKHYSSKELEAIAREMHQAIWKNRYKIWEEEVPADPVDMLNPKIAAELIGYHFSETAGIGQNHTADHDFEVAGTIDNDNKTITISGQYAPRLRRYTAAHEIGHAILHRQLGSIHRDRPIGSAKPGRPTMEKEADEFASYFLMPEKLVRERFTSIFGKSPFRLTDATAFALARTAQSTVRRKLSTPRKIARTLAAAEQYNFKHFTSLAKQFGVSEEAMAIRLEELNLIDH